MSTGKLGNTNYQAIMARANADMQQLTNITASGDWEQILAILQGQAINMLPGAGKSIFNMAGTTETIINGNAQQKAAAFQNILNNISDLLGNFSKNKSTEATRKVQTNDKEIDKNNDEANKLHQSVDAQLQNIMDQCASGAKTIEDALKEIEALGGDKGKIESAKAELQQHIQTIETNKQILNNGVSAPEQKKQALVNILAAASAINSLVIAVESYKEQITQNQAVVEATATEIADLTTNASDILGNGMKELGQLAEKDQAQVTKTTNLNTEGVGDELAGGKQVVIGNGLNKTVIGSAEGAKYILSGNDKINAGVTLMSGAVHGLSALNQSMGQMNSYGQYFAKFTNGIGKFGEGTQELLGQYDTTINAAITSIGSWEQISEANTQLQTYIQEYTSDMGNSQGQSLFGQKTGLGFEPRVMPSSFNVTEKQTKIENTDDKNMNFKEFTFDTSAFKMKK